MGFDMREQLIDLRNGARLNYAEAGSGAAVVFAHGFPESWRRWKPQLDDFARDHRVLAPDMRGFNRSFKPEGVEAYAAGHLAEDITAFIEALCPDPVVLVGHDWGGVAAWLVAMRAPHLVRRLVIINAPFPATFARELAHNPAQRMASQYMNALSEPGTEERILAKDFRGFERGFAENGPPLWYTPELAAHYREAWRQPGALTAMLKCYRASPLRPARPGEDWTPRIPPGEDMAVRVPTLVIWGLRDRSVLPGCLDGLDAYVAQLTILRMPEGSHWVSAEQPEKVNAAIREFIGS
jgi:pimeloyl-ACP methyl ester carboxylesterase